ncbi:MAG TPA: FecR family protein [Verrucomicrobiae bacterium]|nr:FecR family protein [Verrucomicrobiae bacterium]
MKTRILLGALFVSGTLSLRADPLTQSTFTEVVKDVNVVAAATKAAAPASVSEIVKAPDKVRTGPDSRAELTAPDQTITRIGANTVFSFEPSGRNINLEQGNVLFHSPAGKGGGSIRSGGAAAAVLGTTLIVSSTGTGGFKVILLEGKGTVTLGNGHSVNLTAGQLVFVLPGQTGFGPVLEINLGKLVAGSTLVHGFSKSLPSLSLIQNAINHQNHDLGKGKTDTGVPPENFIQNPGNNGLNTVDPNSYHNTISTIKTRPG